MKTLFTIGYANKKLDEFIGILKKYNINCIVDVRSIPYSKQFPDYNSNQLKVSLKNADIKYLHFENEFGARRTEKNVYTKCLDYNKNDFEYVDFEKVWYEKSFQSGVERILIGLRKNLNICFMCSEKQAYDCHRGLMIGEYFSREKNIQVIHLISDSEVYLHEYISDVLENYFYECKKKFEKKNSEHIFYGGGLFSNSNSENVDYWMAFFKNYSYDKGFLLSNIKIGYKKGEVNDE